LGAFFIRDIALCNQGKRRRERESWANSRFLWESKKGIKSEGRERKGKGRRGLNWSFS